MLRGCHEAPRTPHPALPETLQKRVPGASRFPLCWGCLLGWAPCLCDQLYSSPSASPLLTAGQCFLACRPPSTAPWAPRPASCCAPRPGAGWAQRDQLGLVAEQVMGRVLPSGACVTVPPSLTPSLPPSRPALLGPSSLFSAFLP